MRAFLSLSLAVLLVITAPSTPIWAAAGSENDSSTTKPAMTGNASLSALFAQLDANGDGLLSKAEASAVPSIADAYDSFDTAATIQQPGHNASPAGITLDQFEAGMQAAHQGGAFGPAVSGGNHYLQYPDGSRAPVDTSEASTPSKSQ